MVGAGVRAPQELAELHPHRWSQTCGATRRNYVQAERGDRVCPDPSEHDGQPPGKLADAEVIFEAEAGPFTGLTLIGFAVWERRAGGGRNVTFPARARELLASGRLRLAR